MLWADLRPQKMRWNPTPDLGCDLIWRVRDRPCGWAGVLVQGMMDPTHAGSRRTRERPGMGPLTTGRNQPCRYLGLRLQAPQGGHKTFLLFERLFVALWWTAPAKAHSQPSLPDAVGSPGGTDLSAGTKRHSAASLTSRCISCLWFLPGRGRAPGPSGLKATVVRFRDCHAGSGVRLPGGEA